MPVWENSPEDHISINIHGYNVPSAKKAMNNELALPVLLGCWELLLGGRWGVLLLLLGFPELLLAGLLVMLGFACVARGVDSHFQERQVFVTP